MSEDETRGQDYVIAGNEGDMSATIPAGAAETIWRVATIDDSTSEARGTLTAALRQSADYTINNQRDQASIFVNDNDTPIWTADVFEAARTFKDRCQVPRSGIDIEGNPFPDKAGILLDELFWLRSWTDETYLWNDEITDRDPMGFTGRLAYFNQLKTTALTASGKPKDDFHFSESTEAFLERRNSMAPPGYGYRLVTLSSRIPRDIRVLYTEPDSPASTVVNGQANLMRGTRLLKVDDADLVNGNTQTIINTLNAGLSPTKVGETHTFTVQDIRATSTRKITMISTNITRNPVNRTAIIDTSSGKVGYILFNTFSPFSSEKAIADAMTEMSNENVTDLVLDLRYNGGGLLAVASQLSYMVAGPSRTTGKAFEKLQFNADAGNRNPVTGRVNTPVGFTNTGLGFSLASGTPLSTLNLNRLFVLATERTCSASEAVINGLRGIDIEIILIANGKTCGKPFGFYPTDNCGQTYYTIQFQGVNDKDFGDYADGFIPQNSSASTGVRLTGCQVRDDIDSQLGDSRESMLAAALHYRENGSCPQTVSNTSEAVLAVRANSDREVTISAGVSFTWQQREDKDILANNRDMTWPR